MTTNDTTWPFESRDVSEDKPDTTQLYQMIDAYFGPDEPTIQSTNNQMTIYTHMIITRKVAHIEASTLQEALDIIHDLHDDDYQSLEHSEEVVDDAGNVLMEH